MSVQKDQTVNLGGVELRLSAPASTAVRWDIVGYQGINYSRACAAALAACWRGSQRPKARYARYQYSPGAYGGAVLEELLARGLEYSAVIEAGTTALGLLAVGLVSAEEVDDAERQFPVEEGGAGSADSGHRE